MVRSGVDDNGRLLARWVQGYFASGGYAAFKPSTDTTLPGFRRGAIGPYDVPVFRSECHMVYTNTVPCGHMRSPGEAQVAYAIEAHTELVARAMAIDSVTFRARNATQHARPADVDDLDAASDGGQSVPSRAVEVLRTAAEAIDFDQPRPKGIGRGLALIEFGTSPGIYASILRVQRDGRVVIQTPIVEQGAGMLTVFRRIVADELGVPIQHVAIEQSVEDIEEDRGVGGSRTTRLVGKLLIRLSRRLQARLADLVADEFGVAREGLTVQPGGFGTGSGQRVSFAQAAQLLSEPLVESDVLRATERDRSAVFLSQAAEVAVDAETGAVRPLRIVTVQEVGRIIDPLLAQRQIEGAVLQGLGYAVMEQLVVQDGRIQNQNLHEYKVPTHLDSPVTETLMIGHDPRLGITPIGEGAIAGVAPAIVNAVVDVVGVHTFDLPLSPEVVRTVALTEAKLTA